MKLKGEIEMVEVQDQVEEVGQMENVWDHDVAFGRFYEGEEEVKKGNNGFWKGFLIGAGAGAAAGSGVGLGLWFKERRDNKKHFEILEKVIEIATYMENNPTATTMKWKKEDIDLTKLTLNNPLDLQRFLKEQIDEMKFVSKKKKVRYYKDLKLLSELSSAYRGKQDNKEAKDKINATEELVED
jgi:hypothetical protein